MKWNFEYVNLINNLFMFCIEWCVYLKKFIVGDIGLEWLLGC